jgi:predicted Zn-dependent protease
VAQAVQPVQAGVLSTLMPSFYGARRTGLPHVPTAAEGWAVDAGDTPLADLLAGVAEGAIAGRLSMGRPAASGDFSAVVKNGFLLAGGQRGPALAESMVAGNMGRMLLDITAISRERLDTGAWLLPWVRVSGLHFS